MIKRDHIAGPIFDRYSGLKKKDCRNERQSFLSDINFFSASSERIGGIVIIGPVGIDRVTGRCERIRISEPVDDNFRADRAVVVDVVGIDAGQTDASVGNGLAERPEVCYRHGRAVIRRSVWDRMEQDRRGDV